MNEETLVSEWIRFLWFGLSNHNVYL